MEKATKEQINRWARRLLAHRIMLGVNIVWVLLILAVTYAMFDELFAYWLTQQGAFFIPLLMTIQVVWFLIYNYVTKSIRIDNIIRSLNACYSCRRIRKDDYYKILGLLEDAELRQSNYEQGVHLTNQDIKKMKDEKLLETYNKLKEKAK